MLKPRVCSVWRRRSARKSSRTLNLAQQLGATTAVIASAQIAESIVAYARKHNLSKLVIGRDPIRRLWPWQRSSGQKLALLAPDIDLVEIGRAEDSAQEAAARVRPAARADPESSERRKAKRLRYLWAAFACVGVTLLSMPLAAHFDRSNIVAIFILAVVLVGVRFGRGPAAVAAVLSVCAFDFFFVPPRFSFAVSDVQYVLTFVIMLAVGLITGQLTAGLRFQARVAAHREERAGSLYEIRARSVRRGAGRTSRENQRRIHRAHLSRQRRAAAAGCRRQIDRDHARTPMRAWPSKSAPPSGHSIKASRPVSAPIRCRAARCCTFRCARPPRRAACWR